MSSYQKDDQKLSAEKAGKAAGAVLAFGKAGRKARMDADYSDATFISDRLYNLILIGTVLWGVLLSAFLCAKIGNRFDMDPVAFIILYLVVAISGCIIAAKSTKPLWSFLGFNMVAVPSGLLISTVVSAYLEMDPDIVLYAMVYTGLITIGMFGLTIAFPDFVGRLGGMLGMCLGGMIFCEIILLVFGIRQNVLDWVGAGLFSVYIAYDIYRSQNFARTVDNAIDCALDIYLDIANLFLRILRIMAKSKSDD